MPSSNPSPEVLAYFKSKNIRASYNWKDVFEGEHAFSFTVAKATELEALNTIKEDIARAIEEGLSFSSYQKIASARLQKLGWWGKKETVDPKTGEKKLTQLGSKRRLETIFNTNIRAANAAGKWERIERTKKLLPFLEYKIGPSRKHREQHVALNGTVLPVDDPFWNTHYPPNGWGCKCYVRHLTKAAAEDIGISKSPKLEYKEQLNPRTGKIERKYEGVDFGFANNAGKERGQTLSNFLNDKVENISKDIAHTVIKDCIQSEAFKNHYLSGNKQDNNYLPIALITSRKLKEKLKLNHNTSIRFSGYANEKARIKHKDIKPEDYLLVQDVVDKEEIGEDKSKHNHWVGYYPYGDKYNLKVILKKTSKGEIYLQTLFKERRVRKK